MFLKGIYWDVSPLAAQKVSDCFVSFSTWAFLNHEPLLEFLELLNQKVKVNRIWGVQIVFVGMRKSILLGRQ
jgi:hypothetical protein